MLISHLCFAPTCMFSAYRTPQGYAIFILPPDCEAAMHHPLTSYNAVTRKGRSMVLLWLSWEN